MSTEALIEAILLMDAKQVQRLLEAGVSPNLALDSFGLTPLHYAVGHTTQAVIDMLLASGADPHLPDIDGTTPIDSAILLKDYQTLNRFLVIPAEALGVGCEAGSIACPVVDTGLEKT